jgi:ketosteroid isomerase-like protein
MFLCRSSKEEPMRDSIPITLVVSAIILAVVAPRVVAAAEGAGTANLAEDLQATEQAFAQTMADRDHAAFVTFLAEDAVFFGGRGEIRGSEAVAAAWKPFFDGPEAPFSWSPDTAAVLDSGALGLTSGPVLASDGTRIGTFNSVWRRVPDGTWKVVFDRGCPDCECPPAGDASD